MFFLLVSFSHILFVSYYGDKVACSEGTYTVTQRSSQHPDVSAEKQVFLNAHGWLGVELSYDSRVQLCCQDDPSDHVGTYCERYSTYLSDSIVC